MPNTDSFHIDGVPDFDQRRHGLPENGGAYCMPTSTMDLLFYLANRGLPNLKNYYLDLGNKLLKAYPYFGLTLRLEEMGARCGTDPEKGTHGGDWTGGVIDYIENMSSYWFNAQSVYKSKGFPCPNYAMGWMRLGAVACYCQGWYSNPHDYKKIRNGGHCLAITGVESSWTEIPPSYYLPHGGSAYDFSLLIRDPASDEQPDDFYKQSVYTEAHRKLHLEYADFDGTECALYGVGEKPPSDVNLSNGGFTFTTYPYIDSYHVLIPMTMLISPSETSASSAASKSGASAPGVSIMQPSYGSNGGSSKPTIRPLPSSRGVAPIVDLTLHRYLPTAALVAEAGRSVVEIDLTRDTQRQLAVLPAPAMRITAGGSDGSFYVLMKGKMARITHFGELQLADADDHAEVIAFSRTLGSVITVSSTHLSVHDGHMRLRARFEVPLRGEGRLTAEVLDTGEVLTHRRGEPSVRRIDVERHAVAEVSLKGVREPESLVLAGKDRWLVSDAGRLAEHRADGTRSNETPFSAVEAGCLMACTRNFSNAKEAGVGGEGWKDVMPEVRARRDLIRQS
jgi:hypothetical protein